MKKTRFEIGEYVLAKHTISFGYENNKRIIIKSTNEIKGVITGATHRMMGNIKGSSKSIRYDAYDYEPPYLSVTESVFVWKIRQGYMNKEFEALDEDVISLDPSTKCFCQNGKHKIPLKYNHEWYGESNLELRRNLSIDTKYYLRDKKGRFI